MKNYIGKNCLVKVVLRHQELVKSSLSTCADEVDNLVSNNTSPSGKGNLSRGIVDCWGAARYKNFSLFQLEKEITKIFAIQKITCEKKGLPILYSF